MTGKAELPRISSTPIAQPSELSGEQIAPPVAREPISGAAPIDAGDVKALQARRRGFESPLLAELMQSELTEVLDEFRRGRTLSSYDRDRAAAALDRLDRAQMLALKKALLGELDRREVGRTESIDVWPRKKAEQIEHLLEILSGNLKETEPPVFPYGHRLHAEMERITSSVRMLEEDARSKPDDSVIATRAWSMRFSLSFVMSRAQYDDLPISPEDRARAYAFVSRAIERVVKIFSDFEARSPDRAAIDAIRSAIREDRYTAQDLRRELAAREEKDAQAFVERVFGVYERPAPIRPGEAAFLPYSPSPLFAITDLLDQVMKPGEVLCDCGSGLGLICMLHAFLNGERAIGIEYDPRYAAHAREQAAALAIEGATFINTDARKADLSAGDVFYFFNPFGGDVMKEVLEHLREVAKSKPIKLVSLAAHIQGDWLEPPEHTGRLMIYKSKPL